MQLLIAGEPDRLFGDLALQFLSRFLGITSFQKLPASQLEVQIDNFREKMRHKAKDEVFSIPGEPLKGEQTCLIMVL